ncbi:MAG: hypothetical protein GY755_22885 [Chloroflexi bacterium]|nr:hypothetical protein [Chloroflexota bacterium]
MQKTRHILIHLITIMLLTSLSSCSSTVEPPLEFEEGNLNNQVRLFVSPQGNTFKSTDPIALGMMFKTDTDIVFPNNYNLRLFIRDKESWREISEKPVNRYPIGEFVFFPATSPQVLSFFVEPEVVTAQKYWVRIYVSGEMIENGVSKTVASYIDIEMRP